MTQEDSDNQVSNRTGSHHEGEGSQAAGSKKEDSKNGSKKGSKKESSQEETDSEEHKHIIDPSRKKYTFTDYQWKLIVAVFGTLLIVVLVTITLAMIANIFAN